jgi:hypothetical protein
MLVDVASKQLPVSNLAVLAAVCGFMSQVEAF